MTKLWLFSLAFWMTMSLTCCFSNLCCSGKKQGSSGVSICMKVSKSMWSWESLYLRSNEWNSSDEKQISFLSRNHCNYCRHSVLWLQMSLNIQGEGEICGWDQVLEELFLSFYIIYSFPVFVFVNLKNMFLQLFYLSIV